MKSHTTPAFRSSFASLPPDIRRQARSAYRRFIENPRHPSLRLKRIRGSDRLVSVRVSRACRAVGVRGTSGEIVWFWIGSHQEYEKLLTRATR